MQVEIPPYRKPPCAQNCQKRDGECHAHCQEYLTWVEYIRNRNRLIQSHKYIENMADSCNVEVAQKRLKRLGVRK